MCQTKYAVYSLKTPKTKPDMPLVTWNHSKVYLVTLVTGLSINQLALAARAEIHQMISSSFRVAILAYFCQRGRRFFATTVKSLIHEKSSSHVDVFKYSICLSHPTRLKYFSKIFCFVISTCTFYEF